MSISVSELLGKKHSIVAAEHTLKLMHAAAAEENLRLAVSRGITAVIQATAAAMNAPDEIVERAERVVQEVRQVAQSAAIRKVAMGLGVVRQRDVQDRPLPRRDEPNVPWAAFEAQEEIVPQTELVFDPSIEFQESMLFQKRVGSPFPEETLQIEGPIPFETQNSLLLTLFFSRQGIPMEDMQTVDDAVLVSRRSATRAIESLKRANDLLGTKTIDRLSFPDTEYLDRLETFLVSIKPWEQSRLKRLSRLRSLGIKIPKQFSISKEAAGQIMKKQIAMAKHGITEKETVGGKTFLFPWEVSTLRKELTVGRTKLTKAETEKVIEKLGIKPQTVGGKTFFFPWEQKTINAAVREAEEAKFRRRSKTK